ncbi:MAG: response regulator [Bdellovibrionales bacterium]
MDFDQEMIEEFKIEAFDMLDQAESSLLAIDKGEDFNENYNNIFRAFHSLKGGAGMLGLEEVQKQTHFLENLLEQTKETGHMEKVYIDYFLSGCDASRRLLDGEEVDFKCFDPGEEAAGSEKVSNNEPEVSNEDREKAINERAESQNQIWVVDDEEEIREILGELVKDAGFSLREFEDGQRAYEALKETNDGNRPVTIILDMTMPNMTGLELLEKIRGVDPDIPSIFISGNLTKKDVISATNSGVFCVLEKPFDSSTVISNLKNASRRYQLSKLLNRTIKFMFYQFSDLDSYLEKLGKDDLRNYMKEELENLIKWKEELRGK